MMLKHFILFIFLLLSQSFYAQNLELSDQAEISIITIDPGKELVDTFGHSAIRVYDPNLGLDLAFNYGTYDFNAPNFYTNFARGKLNYELSISDFGRFFQYYKAQKRSIKEQVLNLTFKEKKDFFNFLKINSRPENKGYLYDFFFDNCATKLPEVTNKVLVDSMHIDYEFLSDYDLTFRDLIHNNLTDHAWGKFGIDLALGSVIDREAKPEEYLFLPEYVFKGYAHAIHNEKALVKNTNYIYTATEKANPKKSFLSPFVFFLIVALLGIFISYRDHKKKKRTRVLDFFLFIFTGLIGLVVLLLWFATDHSATANNFNSLWAFAPNLFVAFVLLKRKLPKWIIKYLYFLLGLLGLTVLLMVFRVQVFHPAIIPILLLLTLRYIYLIKRLV